MKGGEQNLIPFQPRKLPKCGNFAHQLIKKQDYLLHISQDDEPNFQSNYCYLKIKLHILSGQMQKRKKNH
jgi:hypothetical protein